MPNREKRNLFLLPLLFVAAAVAGGLLWTTATRATAAEGVKPPPPATDLPEAEDQTRAVAVFAGGCFWCEEAVFESFEGVGDVVSGFAGGEKADDATYAKVSSGGTGFAESVQVPYDPSKISYAKLPADLLRQHRPHHRQRPVARLRHPVPAGRLLRHAGAEAGRRRLRQATRRRQGLRQARRRPRRAADGVLPGRGLPPELRRAPPRRVLRPQCFDAQDQAGARAVQDAAQGCRAVGEHRRQAGRAVAGRGARREGRRQGRQDRRPVEEGADAGRVRGAAAGRDRGAVQQPAEQGAPRGRVPVRRVRLVAVRVAGQVRQRHGLAELFRLHPRPPGLHRRPQRGHGAHGTRLPPLRRGTWATSSTTAPSRPASATAWTAWPSSSSRPARSTRARSRRRSSFFASESAGRDRCGHAPLFVEPVPLARPL